MDNNVELHDDETEIVEAQVSPEAGTEEQSVSSVKKAESTGKKAPKRKGDKDQGEKATPKVDAPAESYDFSDDLDALISEEATLSDDFKAKSAIIFEAAISSKVAEEVERLEESYDQRLNEELASLREDLVEKVDSYLNYVVETWMKENELAIQQGLRTEIAEEFMGKLHNLFTESYIEVPESKVDLVDGLAEEVSSLEEKLNAVTSDAIVMSEELEQYKRDAIIREHASDLADTQVEKLYSLVENVDFEDAETFAKKVQTVKESYFRKETVAEDIVESVEEEGEEVVAPSDSMQKYLAAMRKINK